MLHMIKTKKPNGFKYQNALRLIFLRLKRRNLHSTVHIEWIAVH